MKRTARTVDGIQKIGKRQWARLDTDGNPFVEWAFLHALEASGSVAAENGWQPHHLCIYEGDDLVAAAPAYIKSHSRGEFVFDWAWADAYHRSQLEYYPKLLTAVPWTPVTGPRLLVAKDHADAGALRARLIELGLARCEALELSSWHCNFIDAADLEAFGASQLLPRVDCQFHWYNRGYASFDDFLATLKSKKRKNIRQERRQVVEAGISFRRKPGRELRAQDLAFIHRCYRRTFHAYGNHPALTLECFEKLAESIPQAILAVLAYQDATPIAMSFCLQGGGVLYGRYWGCVRDLPGLHFETAYYQGIEHCIEQGLARFESGAQGEHKIARGFEPVKTRSFHHIAHEGFRQAIAHYLSREAEWLESYRGEIARHEPFRAVSRG